MVDDRVQYTLAKEIARGEIKKEEVREAFFKNDSIGWRKFERQYLNNVEYLYRRGMLIGMINTYMTCARNNASYIEEISDELQNVTNSLAELKRDTQLQSMLHFYRNDPKAQARMKIIYAGVEKSYQESLANKTFIRDKLQQEYDYLLASIDKFKKQIETGDALLLLDILGVI